MTPRVAVVIVSWNVRDYTLACVRALMEEQIEREIVVVDNASSDNTAQAIQKEFPQISVIANATNRGFAAAVNQGVAATTAPIIFLLNPDTKIQSGALTKLAEKFEHADAEILGAHLVKENRETISSVRANPSAVSQVLILLKAHRIMKGLLSHYFQRRFDYSREQEVEQVMGSAMAFRRDVFNSLHGFDEKFFILFEEVDFCKRAQEASKKIIYSPDVVATDFAGKSFVQIGAVKRAQYFTASLNYYAQKHFSLLGRLCIRGAGFIHRLLSYGVQRAGVTFDPRP